MSALTLGCVLAMWACVGDTGTSVVLADAGSAGADGGAAGDDGGGASSIPTSAIADLRNPASANRPGAGTMVKIEGAIVTNVKSVGNTKLFFVQDPTAKPFGGIAVTLNTAAPTVSPGAVVTAYGQFATYKGLDEIVVASGGGYMQTGMAAVPAPIDVTIGEIVTGGTHGTDYQSMLVRLKSVTATGATNSVIFPVVDSASPGITIYVTSFYANDTGPSPFPATNGEKFLSITGNLVANGVSSVENQLAPGRAADVVAQ